MTVATGWVRGSEQPNSKLVQTMNKHQLADKISGQTVATNDEHTIMRDMRIGADVKATYPENLRSGDRTVDKVRAAFNCDYGHSAKQVYFGDSMSDTLMEYETAEEFARGESRAIQESIAELVEDLGISHTMAATGILYDLTRSWVGIQAEKALMSEFGFTPSERLEDRSGKVDMWSGDLGIQIKPSGHEKRPNAVGSDNADYDVLVCYNSSGSEYVFFAEPGPTTHKEADAAYIRARDYW